MMPTPWRLHLPGRWSFRRKRDRPSKLGDGTMGFTLPLVKETIWTLTRPRYEYRSSFRRSAAGRSNPVRERSRAGSSRLDLGPPAETESVPEGRAPTAGVL